jgi:hypothetical protein
MRPSRHSSRRFICSIKRKFVLESKISVLKAVFGPLYCRFGLPVAFY